MQSKQSLGLLTMDNQVPKANYLLSQPWPWAHEQGKSL